nr:hypothetical protein GCM10020185_14700 [Pseudomonas brassicacearum subsp. brassicacearum]
MLISLGLAVSLLGALLSWALLCAEILYATARDKTMPAFLTKEKCQPRAGQRAVADQWHDPAVFLLITLFSAGTYTSLIYLASSMILVPYLWSAAYAVLLCARGKPTNRARPGA